MSDEKRQKWDTIYSNGGQAGAPSRILSENKHLLPGHGRALEIACGRGANALFLAGLGLDTSAWDISPVVISAMHSEAEHQGLAIEGEVRDVMQEPPPNSTFDVIIVSHFLERGLIGLIKKALRPGGLLFYQTFTQTRVSDRGPTNQDFRLADNELLKLCDGMRVLVYREEGIVGNISQGFRDLALIVAQKT